MAHVPIAGWSRLRSSAIGLIVAGLTLLASSGNVQASSQPAPAASSGLGKALLPSTNEQMALVGHLLKRGAVFYGAWWCPHCFFQKNLFGTEAGERLPYVECDREETGRRRCQTARIRAYPTWELGGEKKEGVQSIEELKAWSGYKAVSPTP
jgi:hypothetical protein